jgi:dTDP-4-dehydrorhamnose 3,5-epimerase
MPIISAFAHMNMAVVEFRSLGLAGLLEVLTPRIEDSRGFFSETWSRLNWEAAGVYVDFVQDNHSRSDQRGVVRGLHYQLPPMAQDKLVRVISGAIFDVAVDVRKSSPTFGQWTGLVLSAKEWNQLLVPKGLAHGFVTLEPGTEVQYKVSAPYSAEHERGIRFDDPAIGIEWPDLVEKFQLSPKDRAAPLLAEAELFP